jgi:hydrogenase maturation protein HypF
MPSEPEAPGREGRGMNMAGGAGPWSAKRRAVHLTVFGVVQGVGFRPFIYRLAHEFGLKGWVKNAGHGVEIRIEAPRPEPIDGFFSELRRRQPPLSRIERVSRSAVPFRGFKAFKIRKTGSGRGFVFISPDIAVCPECLAEIHDPGERRYLYPFTNCTNCGPRYTIVRALPYDRKSTTMAGFPMCADCAREYGDPLDRRYHAQPIACPVCGPRVSLRKAGERAEIPGGIPAAARLIKRGKILAIKGIGGFHLVCDPLNARAIGRLRRIKDRKAKPLALMAADMRTIRRYAAVSPAERKLLLSPERPIVLLAKTKDIPGVAPGLDEIGFMLPYSPLHEILLGEIPLIAATSSNRKDAPIIKSEEEGIGDLCDFVLTHDRPIETRSDDSVVKAVGQRALFVRRARGFVPFPQTVPAMLRSSKVVAALGGELKDTVSLYKDGYVITSQFLGDLDDYRNFRYFEETLAHLGRLFDAKPEILVTDLHPDFRTTRFAQKSGLRHLQVQHHHAHILAPLLEHGIPPGRKVLGVALDGYGYGMDGKAWGGEFLIADYSSFSRLAHFYEVPMPGGDSAARQPWRMALSYLKDAFGPEIPLPPGIFKAVGRDRVRAVLKMLERNVGSPPSSSCGRLFDAVSFLCGLSPAEMEYEAEAAMKLEAAARAEADRGYPFSLTAKGLPIIISFAPAIRGIVDDLKMKLSVSLVAARFHRTLVEVILEVARRARREYGTTTVSLAGGCFLNKKLLAPTERLLARRGFTVLRPEAYSPNDESISIGQIAFALARLGRPGD